MPIWLKLHLQSNCLGLDWAPAQLQFVFILVFSSRRKQSQLLVYLTWVGNKFYVQRKWSLTNNFVPKNVSLKNFWPQKNVSLKTFLVPNKSLGPKTFWSRKKFGSEKRINFWSKFILVVINFGTKNIFSRKKVFGQNDFRSENFG